MCNPHPLRVSPAWIEWDERAQAPLPDREMFAVESESQ